MAPPSHEPYTQALDMIRILGTMFAALAGLSFGSFLNVCLSRWPQGESVVKPRSHCLSCGRTLVWWENLPLASWLVLGGRCRSCRAWIGWRHPLVELAVGALWAACWYDFAVPAALTGSTHVLVVAGLRIAGFAVFYWLLVGLAVLDAEHLWLPDAMTLPGTALGVIFTVLRRGVFSGTDGHPPLLLLLLDTAFSILAAAGLILLIRWVYWLVRRREGIGLGDAKLMALLAAWLGLQGALLSFGLGVVLGAAVALGLLAFPALRGKPESWALSKLPLGTFLCIGGVISGLWGEWIVASYLRWAGF
jgi:leader peptidase (prepilin peptidase)/N-methyltransferase